MFSMLNLNLGIESYFIVFVFLGLHNSSLCVLLFLEPRLERKRVKRKRVFATLKVLGAVLEQLSPEIPDEVRCVVLLKLVKNLSRST